MPTSCHSSPFPTVEGEGLLVGGGRAGRSSNASRVSQCRNHRKRAEYGSRMMCQMGFSGCFLG